MGKIQVSTNHRMIHAIETNQYALWLETAQITGHPWYQDEHITWVNCNPSPSPNGIFAAHLSANEADLFVKWVKSQIQNGKAPRKWMTGPTQQPQNLEDLLASNGFVRRTETLGMALDLSSLIVDKETSPSGLEIREANRFSLPDWAQIVGTGLFQCTKSESTAFGKVMGTMMDHNQIIAYLAYCNNKPVAASMVYFSEGVAGIYYVATLPEYRGQGIGHSITFAPLLKAREMGYPTAILQATEAGASVYRKLGFKGYSLLGRYWLPDS